MSASSMELTKYIGDAVNVFERGTRTKLSEKDKGVYILENSIQLLAPGGKIASITLLEDSKEFTIHGLSVGMGKEEADAIIDEVYEGENSKTVTSHDIVYLYLMDNTELYVTYDIDNEKIIEISYYNYKTKSDKEIDWDDTTDGELIALVGDTKVFYKEAMVYLKSVQANYEGEFGKGIWDVDIYGDNNSFGNVIKEEVIKQITQLKVIKDKALEHGVELNEEELSNVSQYATEHLRGLSDRDIDKYHITLDLLEEVYRDNLLAEKMYEMLTINVDTDVSDEEAKQITVWDILISGDGEEEKSKAQALLDQAKEVDDFYALAEANTEAEKIEYTFGKGQGPEEYGQAFENAAMELSTGEISKLISTEEGWHIIYCVSDYDEDATIREKEEIIEQRRLEMFAKIYEEWSSEYEVIINSQAWESIKFED